MPNYPECARPLPFAWPSEVWVSTTTWADEHDVDVYIQLVGLERRRITFRRKGDGAWKNVSERSDAWRYMPERLRDEILKYVEEAKREVDAQILQERHEANVKALPPTD